MSQSPETATTRFVGTSWTRDLSGRWAVITGASSGIGLQCALALATQKCNIVLCARDVTALSKASDVVAALGVQVRSVSVDLGNIESTEAAISGISSAVGSEGVYVLVNSAGIAGKGSVADCDVTRWLAMVDLNVRGLMHLTRLVVPLMTRADGGAIVNIGSDMALKWGPGQGAYCATKAAVTAFTRCIYEDVRERGIKVSVLMPGIVNTPLQAGRSGIDFEKCIQSEDIARLVLFVVNFPGTSCPTEMVIEPQRSPYPKPS
eukprot:TRINITY_DN3315_c0_g1_i1.p1 TRINITY_DN3315_c0_g1~~TRINITY_DN3315_c0_g1_i1.p1  ORF type:complete len:262 (-),score=28.26 TRINITY_DN3315_c0_g1_i1:912-1697(-)